MFDFRSQKYLSSRFCNRLLFSLVWHHFRFVLSEFNIFAYEKTPDWNVFQYLVSFSKRSFLIGIFPASAVSDEILITKLKMSLSSTACCKWGKPNLNKR